MKDLHIIVVNKIATYQKRDGEIVCGNNDYQIKFTFDSEWSAHEKKIARFIWGGQFQDVEFTGNTCPLPAVHRTDFVSVGVYAGDLCTTTPAVIPCQRSILCGSDTPHAENEANYASEAQLAAEAAQEAANEAKRAAGEAAGEAVASFAEQSAAQLLGGIVQTTGGSETNVMSQRAVTKELSNIYKGALKGTARGEAVTIDDVSPVEHDMGVTVSSKNLIPFNYTTYSNNYGINFTVNTDGSITMDGTSKGSTYYIIEIAKHIRVDAGIYTISSSATLPDGVNLWLRVVKNGEATSTVSNKTITFTEPTDICCYISVKTGTTLNNLTIYPQIEKGAVATAYTPYVDVDTVKVSAQGKNLMNKELWKASAEGVLVQEGDVYTLTWTEDTGIRYTDVFPLYIPANTTITVSIEHVEINMDDNIATRCGTVYISLYDANKQTQEVGVQLEKDAPIKTVTITKDVYYGQLFLTSLASKGDSVKFKNLQVEVGTAATEYEPYITPVEYEAGTVKGIKSIYPSTTLTTDTTGAVIDVQYNRDINKAFAELQQAIISLGGNI